MEIKKGLTMGIKINYAFCIGCKICYQICPMDIFGCDDKTHFITVDYPEECWYCGACVFDCPIKGAISIELPLACL